MAMEATEKRMEQPSVPKMASYEASPKMATKMPAWGEEDSMEKSYTEKQMASPGVPKMASYEASPKMASYEGAREKMATKMPAWGGEEEMREFEASPRAKMAPGVAVGRSIPADREMMATHSTIDIRPITIAVNNLNTTINKVLTAIESRLKKNDINSQLKKMTQFISEINDSLPMPSSGGGTRRANIKKRKKTLRSRKNL